MEAASTNGGAGVCRSCAELHPLVVDLKELGVPMVRGSLYVDSRFFPRAVPDNLVVVKDFVESGGRTA